MQKHIIELLQQFFYLAISVHTACIISDEFAFEIRIQCTVCTSSSAAVFPSNFPGGKCGPRFCHSFVGSTISLILNFCRYISHLKIIKLLVVYQHLLKISKFRENTDLYKLHCLHRSADVIPNFFSVFKPLPIGLGYFLLFQKC